MLDPNALLVEVIKEARSLKIPVSRLINPNVFVNSRIKRRFGSCKGNAFGYTIEISSKVAQASEHAIKEILAHEILHTCFGCKNHGERWKSYAQKMNQAFSYSISRTKSPAELGVEDNVVVRYTLRCQKCGNEFNRIKKSNFVNHPERYHCSCGGKITRIL